jgi:hypothetical protein
MYAHCTLYLHNLDETHCPDKKILKEFRFTYVKTALVNAMTAISNQPATKNQQGITMEEVVHLLDERIMMVRREFKKDILSIKDDVVAEAHTYTDLVALELKDQLDGKFEEMMGFLSNTRKLLKAGTSPRPVLEN